MAKKEQTYTIKIDAELQGLQKKVGDARDALDGLLKSGNAPKGLVSAFEKLEQLLGRIGDKSKQTPSKSLFSGLGKDLEKAELLFGDLARAIDGLKDNTKIKLDLFPPDEKAKIEGIIASLAKYTKSLDIMKKKQAEVDATQKVSEKASKFASDAKKNKVNIKRERETVATKREGLVGQIAALSSDPEKNAAKIAKLQGEVGNLDLKIKHLNTDYNEASKILTEANKAADSAAQTYANLSKELSDMETDELNNLSKAATKAGVSIDKIDGETTKKEMERLGKATEKYVEDALAGLPSNVNKANEALKEHSQEFINLNAKVKEGAEVQREFEAAVADTKAFENRIKQFLGLQGAAQVLRHALRDAMSTISELDATMTEMSVVTDLDVSDYWDQLPQYTERANELGLAINDVYKADTLFYQQGLKTNEVVAISTETMKMAKIAGLDTAEATDRMTAALRGFNMELNEASAQKISDVYSELAAITAADVDEISTAMTKTASIASSAGMEFETTAAFLSQIIETTRESAETAGTAMKTVIARFQELKKDPSEIGEIDGEIVDANAIEKALRSVGVALRDSKGQFRELDEVFLELSSKWDGLDKNTQRYIATIAAGSRQQSRFIAMMSDYGRTQELVTAANTSAGASNRQFEKTLDSLRSKVEKLKNAWHEFTMGILESDLVKFGVDVLTKFLEIVNKATSAFNGMGGSLTKIASVLAIFKLGSKIFEKLKPSIESTFGWIAENAGLKGYEAGKNFAKQAEQGARDQMAGGETSQPESKQEEKESKTFGQKIKDTTGVVDFQSGWKKRGEARKKLKAAKKETGGKKKLEKNLKNLDTAGDEEEIEAAKIELKKYQELQQEVSKEGKEGWLQVSEGLSKMAQCATAAGVGVSMLGGLLSSMGLEKIGEGMSWFGNLLTVVGTAASAAIPIVTALFKALTVGGATAQAACWWIVAIVAGIAILLVGIIAIVNAVKNASPEKKLEDAQKAASEAAEAADEAAEAYENLANSFDQLEDKYDALEVLTKGTKEWNAAVKEINNSVLDLISKYPKLAKLVKNEGGVLTLDVESPEAQAIMDEYEKKSIKAQANATQANITVLERQKDVYREDVEVAYNPSNAAIDDLVGIYGEAMAKGLVIENDGKLQITSGASEEQLKEAGISQYGLDYFSIVIGDNIDSLQEYSERLNATNEQQAAYYDALALQSQQLIDLSGKTKEELDQINNLFNGEDYKKAEDDVRKQVEKEYGTNKKAKRDAVEDYLKKQGAINIDAGRNETTYYDASGEKHTVSTENLYEEMISNMTQDEAANIQENIGESIKDVIAQTVTIIGDENGAVTTAMNHLFAADDGAELSSGDLAALSGLDDNKLKEIYKNLGDEAKKLFKTEEDFINTVNTATTGANNAFVTVTDEVKKLTYLTSGQATKFQEKLNALDKESADKVLAATDTLTAGKDKETQQNIQGAINAADWSSESDLIGLYYELTETWGIGANEAQAYIDVLKQEVEITKRIKKSDEIWGNFQKSVDKANKALEKATDLQWDYERLLNKGADATELAANIEAQRQEYLKAGNEALNAYNHALDMQAEAFADGINFDESGVDLTKYVDFDVATGTYDFTRLNDAVNGKTVDGELANKYIEKLQKAQENSAEQLKVAKDSYEQLEALNEQAEQAYQSLYEQVGELITTEIEKGISVQQDILDATESANDKMLNKMQEQIDESRQIRENTEKEENIANMQSRLAYLGMNTSGATALEQAQLQKQIEEAEQDYQDSLIDQSLQDLSDANTKAAEQRERQIAISEQQLEAYKNSAAYEAAVMQELDAFYAAYDSANAAGVRFDPKDTALGERLSEAFTTGMNQFEETAFWDEITSSLGQSVDWYKNNKLGINEGGALDLLEAIKSNTTKEAVDNYQHAQSWAAEETKYDTLDENLRYDRSKLGVSQSISGSESNLMKFSEINQTVSAWASQDHNADTSQTDWLTTHGSKYGVESFLSKEDYFKANADKVAGGESVATYKEYIADKYQTAKNNYDSEKAAQRENRQRHAVNQYGEFDRWLDSTVLSGDYKVADFHEEKIGGNSDNNWLNYVAFKKCKDEEITDFINSFGPAEDASGGMYWYSDAVYYSNGKNWYKTDTTGGKDRHDRETNAYLALIKKKYGYKTGGLADFTGPAWLDGTPSRPEYVLNADQTERFFTLIDVLKDYDINKDAQSARGDNYFDINISVDKLENDYDVEQVADKIRRMIYDDATYRNVNAINHIR